MCVFVYVYVCVCCLCVVFVFVFVRCVLCSFLLWSHLIWTPLIPLLSSRVGSRLMLDPPGFGRTEISKSTNTRVFRHSLFNAQHCHRDCWCSCPMYCCSCISFMDTCIPHACMQRRRAFAPLSRSRKRDQNLPSLPAVSLPSLLAVAGLIAQSVHVTNPCPNGKDITRTLTLTL